MAKRPKTTTYPNWKAAAAGTNRLAARGVISKGSAARALKGGRKK